MFSKYFNLLLLISKLVTCQRRITNGSSVSETVDTNFMVYLVGASLEYSDPGWMCGGSIIHASLVLTSAACLEDVERIYVIAGYRKYVSTGKLDQNRCTKTMKKKITSYTLSHKYGGRPGTKFNSTQEEEFAWTLFDIGIARVDTPFDFYDYRYETLCSYRPYSISVNYQLKFEKPGTNAVVYGWGHSAYYRPDEDLTDYNEESLKYTSAIIMDQKKCKALFKSDILKSSIAQGCICADGEGVLDAHGRFTTFTRPKLDMCTYRYRRNHNNTNNDDASELECYEADTNNTALNNTSEFIDISKTRRHGICQNDHGSPLVMWAGGRPYAIGVASAFYVTKRMECVGPYLYASIKCMSKFVHCVLSAQTKKISRRNLAYCNAPDKERGFKMKENNVTWNDEHQDRE